MPLELDRMEEDMRPLSQNIGRLNTGILMTLGGAVYIHLEKFPPKKRKKEKNYGAAAG